MFGQGDPIFTKQLKRSLYNNRNSKLSQNKTEKHASKLRRHAGFQYCDTVHHTKQQLEATYYLLSPQGSLAVYLISQQNSSFQLLLFVFTMATMLFIFAKLICLLWQKISCRAHLDFTEATAAI